MKLEDSDRTKWFLGSYILLLKKLISFITLHFKKRCQGEFAPGEFKILVDANKSLALFVRNLFSYLDRGHALDMVDTYVKEIHPENIEDVPGTKLLFFKFGKKLLSFLHYLRFPENYRRLRTLCSTQLPYLS